MQKVESLAKVVKTKTNFTLIAYCRVRGLSYASLRRGFVSKEAAKRLKRDGVIAGIEPIKDGAVKPRTPRYKLVEIGELRARREDAETANSSEAKEVA